MKSCSRIVSGSLLVVALVTGCDTTSSIDMAEAADLGASDQLVSPDLAVPPDLAVTPSKHQILIASGVISETARVQLQDWGIGLWGGYSHSGSSWVRSGSNVPPTVNVTGDVYGLAVTSGISKPIVIDRVNFTVV